MICQSFVATRSGYSLGTASLLKWRNHSALESAQEVAGDFVEIWRVFDVSIGNAVDFSSRNATMGIDERVEHKTRLFARINANDRDFDHAVSTGRKSSGFEVDDGDGRFVDWL